MPLLVFETHPFVMENSVVNFSGVRLFMFLFPPEVYKCLIYHLNCACCLNFGYFCSIYKQASLSVNMWLVCAKSQHCILSIVVTKAITEELL